ncbi:SAP domain-containing protein [Halobacillus rhizosphaerae]|uniref:SAP domain-containing protein n=1 Tax=Halobacillus rhizosphaerae TaxID=3064889 RepID=UPI00398AA849
MKMEEVLPKMSKLYLSRIVDSFLKDVRLKSEEEMREVILKNIDEFQNSDRVKLNLDFLEADRDIALVNEMILMSLMENEGYTLSENELFACVEDLEKQILKESEDEEFIKTSIPEEALRIYTAVLVAAWKKDDSLNAHEINMLNVLKTELGLSNRDHYLIESKVGRFPQKGNKLHSLRQVEKSLKDLQSRGIILRFKDNEAYYIIPHEIARVVRYELGSELRKETYLSLLTDLNVAQLKSILSPLGLSMSGTKNSLIDRIIKHNILPTSALNFLSNTELKEVLRNLDGAKISGTKEEKIKNIIDYYENLASISDSDPTDSRSRLYDFYEELASRNYKSLRINKIIDKDLDVEHKFEEATQYIFEKKFGIDLVDMKGSKHADGKLQYNQKEVILWDNKSVENPYNFPDSHFDQFLGYIRTEPMRVTLFLIITSDYTNESISKAQKLKAFSEEDTDIALISAEDLKYIAESWKEFSGQKEPEFNLQVFNLTGELTRNILTNRMEWAIQ